MSEDSISAANGSTQQEDQATNGSTTKPDDTPRFNLYVRASLVDHVTQGACPMSQQGFMLCYLLAQEKNVDFKVWTVSHVNPPADFKEKNKAKIYPFVEGVSGKDVTGQPIQGVMPESADKTEDFLESVNNDCPHLKRPRNLKACILGKIDNISTAFNNMMKGIKGELVTKTLQKVEDHLSASGTTFLEGEILTYTDCFLLPRLQHIIVAGKYYQDYEIPRTMLNVWRYLRDAYETPAFRETLPTDADLCKFHWERFGDTVRSDFKKKNRNIDRFGLINPDEKTDSIPKDIDDILKNLCANGDEVEEQEPEVEEVQQQIEEQVHIE